MPREILRKLSPNGIVYELSVTACFYHNINTKIDVKLWCGSESANINSPLILRYKDDIWWMHEEIVPYFFVCIYLTLWLGPFLGVDGTDGTANLHLEMNDWMNWVFRNMDQFAVFTKWHVIWQLLLCSWNISLQFLNKWKTDKWKLICAHNTTMHQVL